MDEKDKVTITRGAIRMSHPRNLGVQRGRSETFTAVSPLQKAALVG